jgi:hypothetical protein
MKNLALFIFSISLALMISCEKSSLRPNTHSSPNGPDVMQMLSGGSSSDSVRGIISISAHYSKVPLSFPDSSTFFNYVLSFRQGMNFSGATMNVGNGYIGNQNLYPRGVNSNLYGHNSYDSSIHDANFGKTISFGFAGNGSVGALSDSLYLPKIIRVSYPFNAQTTKSSGGLTFTWDSDANNSYVYLYMETSFYENIADRKSYQKILTDNGSYTLTSSDLSNFESYKNVSFYLIRGNGKQTLTSTNDRVFFMSYSMSSGSFKLYP